MTKGYRISMLVIVILAAIGAFLWGGGEGSRRAEDETADSLPSLVDLGSKKCIPCKKMAPILEGLKRDFEGRMRVQFIDVREDLKAADEYGIRLIPTQIFFDRAGRELYRHEGFIGREAILAKWRELGIDLGDKDSRSSGVEG